MVEIKLQPAWQIIIYYLNSQPAKKPCYFQKYQRLYIGNEKEIIRLGEPV